jgi:hypothetical protein
VRLRDSAKAFCPSDILESARDAVGDDPTPYTNADALRVLCAAFEADRGDMHAPGLQRTRSLMAWPGQVICGGATAEQGLDFVYRGIPVWERDVFAFLDEHMGK